MAQENRPSAREINKKLSLAKSLISSGKTIFVSPQKLFGEFQRLKLEPSEVWEEIRLVLDEIKHTDYAGQSPPEKSYERTIEGKDLFAFAWYSDIRRRRMYLKFAITTEYFYYVSYHFEKRRPQ